MSKFAAAACLSVLAVASAAWGKGSVPDTIYVNGKVVTVNPAFDIREAVAVSDGKILAVGTTAQIRAMAKGSTTVIDLGGKTMLPGFNDNHIHLGEPLQPWKYSSMIGRVEPWLQGVDTIPELLAAIKGQAATLPKGTWIIGEIPREEWPNGTLPNRWAFDAAAPDHPVAIARGPHTLIVNSKAFEAAKVTPETKPEGGEIVRDGKGEPTGIVLESARRVIWNAMPPGAREGAGDPEKRLADWRELLHQLESLGITSVNVAGVRPNELKLVDTLYARWGDELPRMVVQLRVSPGYDQHDDVAEGVRVSIAELDALGKDRSKVFKHPKLKLGAVKMSIDGGLSAPIFWSIKPYRGRPGFHGEQRIPDTAFYAVAKRAAELNWQVGIHTMGDAAVQMVANEMEKVRAAVPPKSDPRDYVHHVAAPLPEETMQKMARLKLNVASQPGFLLSLGSYADEALEPEAAARQDPSRSLLDRGIRVSYGSDAGPYGPVAALYAAVTRVGWNGKVHGPEEAVTVKEAITMHTLEPAWFTFDEKTKGSIEPGKVADLVVLSDDPLTIPPERLQDIKIERTVIGGRDVFVRDQNN